VVNHVVVPVDPSPSYDDLAALVMRQAVTIAGLEAALVDRDARIAELERRVGADSSNSSRPPSSDAPWDKKPAKKRSSRGTSGRKPGKQPGSAGSARALTDDPDEVVRLDPGECTGCGADLSGGVEVGVERRQVADIPEPVAAHVIEYRRISRCCRGCGAVTGSGWDHPKVRPEHAAAVGGAGCPARIGPNAAAVAAFLTCAQWMPVGRAHEVMAALTGFEVSVGWIAAIRGRAAALLSVFGERMRRLLAACPVLHADETTARADKALRYVHVACTEYLTLMHVGGRSSDDIDAGGVLAKFTGVLMRDGYAGYTHLPAVHAWCAAHLIRDLRSVSDADPDGQTWALAMSQLLLDANAAAGAARAAGEAALDERTLAEIRNRYLGALRQGDDENHARRTTLAADARTLINRFRRYEDMILRFAVDLTVPFTNNEAERTLRPVKVQQRTSGGTWRTLQGLIDFAIVQSYLDTAHKWGISKLQALQQLFTTGPWLPPDITPHTATAA
jgi:transposase